MGGMGPPIRGTSWTLRVVVVGFAAADDDNDDDDEAPAAAAVFGLDITGWVTARFRAPCWSGLSTGCLGGGRGRVVVIKAS